MQLTTEKNQYEMEAAAIDEKGQATAKAQQSLQMLRKMVHLIARLQIKSGAEMAFPILFGYMSFSTHRTWEINVRRATALLWKSWEANHGKSLQRFRTSATFRHTFNMFLPQEKKGQLPTHWLVLEIPSDTLDQQSKSIYLSPRDPRFESYDDAAVQFA